MFPKESGFEFLESFVLFSRSFILIQIEAIGLNFFWILDLGGAVHVPKQKNKKVISLT